MKNVSAAIHDILLHSPVALQLDCQRQVKEVFINQDALAIVVALAAEPLSKSARMNEQDSQLVQLVITFVRNLLCIEDRTATAGQLLPVALIALASVWKNIVDCLS